LAVATSIVLFTRDLRVHDNPPLAAASQRGGQVLPLFVLDQALISGRAGTPNRIAFLLDSLRDLDRSLTERGARLLVRRGDAVEEALKLARETGAEAIHLSEDASGFARRRQARLSEACERSGLRLRTFSGINIVPPGEVLPAEGDHYRVFTPYWRAWSRAARPKPLRSPRRLRMPSGVRPGRLPALGRLTGGNPADRLPAGGESAGRARLERWLRSGGPAKLAEDERLDADHGSRLSPYIHLGCLSAGELVARTRGRPGGEELARSLCWRDFHHQVLAARPDLPYADYRDGPRRWRKDHGLLEAWRVGRTGYPIVDAGMRQLAAEGFLPNRARLIVASFLTKTLGIDWREGAAHFERLLVDADLANNSGNWQWMAGTGNDTRPNRVLNPIRQAHRFDPDGDYVRRHVPELDEVEGRAVHEPWKLEAEARRGLHYPEPVVEPGVRLDREGISPRRS
jgi:deoxyribodipyrimidine photo-lyase